MKLQSTGTLTLATLAAMLPLACGSQRGAEHAAGRAALRKALWLVPPAAIAGDRNITYQFRREFDINNLNVQRFFVRAGADSRFQLFINGTLVARGPVPAHPDDEMPLAHLEITKYLKTGRNAIAANVYFYGENVHLWQKGFSENGALHVSLLEIRGDEHKHMELAVPGGEWKCRRAVEWDENAPRVNSALGFVEIYNSQKAEEGWTLPGFDDSRWTPAEEIRLRGLDIRSLLPPPPPDYKYSIARPAADGGKVILNKTGESEWASPIVDFGGVIAARPYVELDGVEAGDELELHWSERIDGAGNAAALVERESFGRQWARYRCKNGRQRFQVRDRYGFRYLQITAKSKRNIQIIDAGAEREEFGGVRAGDFECSDPILNKIWSTGVETLRNCMIDAFLDCPGREQRQYLGDARVQNEIAAVLYNNYPHFGRARMAFFEHLPADGMTPIVAPGDAKEMNKFIPDYALHGICMLLERPGFQLLPEEKENVLRVLDWFLQFERPDGLIGNVPGWLFLDWAPLDHGVASATLNALYYQTLSLVCGDPGLNDNIRKKLKNRADRARASFEKFYNSQIGLYQDALLADGTRSQLVSVHANSMAIVSEIAPRERWNAMARAISDPARVLPRKMEYQPGMQIDFNKSIISASPFFQYFVLRALAKAELYDLAIVMIRDLWGKSLQIGGTTFGEDWERDPDSSDCHAWSSSPTWFLSRYVLGVQETRASGGGVTFAVRPHFVNLQFARGAVATPRGEIRVEWSAEPGGHRIRVDGPGAAGAPIIYEGKYYQSGDLIPDAAAAARAQR